MKQFHQTILPILLLISCFVFAALAKRNEFHAAALWKGVVEKQVEAVALQATKPSHQDLLGLRNLITLIAKSNGFPVNVTVQGDAINVSLDAASTTKEEALSNDQGLYQFLYTISALPYRMKFTKFDLGIGAGSGLDFTIQVEGI